jgi:hypothetical protein
VAQRIEIVDLTVVAGTLKTAPSTITLTWREGYPEFMEFRFPPGPSGQVGLQVLQSGARIIPKAANTFLVTDNELVRWDLEGYPYNAKYTVRIYNEGKFDHTVQLRVGLNEIGRKELTRPGSSLPPIVNASPGALLEGLEVP